MGLSRLPVVSQKMAIYIYLLAGAITIVYGGFCFSIPDSPVDARFLSAEEKNGAVERLRAVQTSIRSHKMKSNHFKNAFLDLNS